jgi:hypothetical protein
MVARGFDLQASINATPGGGTLLVPAGVYPAVTGKNITIRADGSGPIGMTGSIDFTGFNDWTLDGWVGHQQLWSMGAYGVQASGTTNGKVVGIGFTDTTLNFADNGSAVGSSNSANLLVANCNFLRSTGGPVGGYNMTGLALESNDFWFCGQINAYNCFTGGANMIVRNNFSFRPNRGGTETGGTGQSYTNFLITGNQIVNQGHGGATPFGPLSWVGHTLNTGTISYNWIDLGPLYLGGAGDPLGYEQGGGGSYAEALELYLVSDNDIHIFGNTILNFPGGLSIHAYGTGTPDVHDNNTWNVPATYYIKGSTPGTAGFNALGFAPQRPAHPLRYKWP